MRLSECMGLDPHRQANLETPKLLIVDRKPEFGRSFENVVQLQQELQAEFPQASVMVER